MNLRREFFKTTFVYDPREIFPLMQKRHQSNPKETRTTT